MLYYNTKIMSKHEQKIINRLKLKKKNIDSCQDIFK